MMAGGVFALQVMHNQHCNDVTPAHTISASSVMEGAGENKVLRALNLDHPQGLINSVVATGSSSNSEAITRSVLYI
jgi:hypothetical protein